MTKYRVVTLPKKGGGWPKKAFFYTTDDKPRLAYTFIRQKRTSNWVGHGIHGMSITKIIQKLEIMENKNDTRGI